MEYTLLAYLYWLILSTWGIAASDFLLPANGTAISSGDDSCVGSSVLQNFAFYGIEYSIIYVCPNGIISLDTRVSSTSASSSRPVIAPFWTDLNLSEGGTMYHRSASRQDLNILTRAIALYGFEATHGHIVSWVKVAKYHKPSETNSFQAALASNGPVTFVIFSYASCNSSAIMGIYSGDPGKCYQYEISGNSSITQLSRSFNVSTAGQFIFRVDSTAIPRSLVSNCDVLHCTHGRCLNERCKCVTGWRGESCDQKVDWCLQSNITCSNHGLCTDNTQNDGWICRCNHDGYSGRLCEVVTNWCEESGISCSGNGDCRNNAQNSNWTCNCRKEYYGEQCQTNKICKDTKPYVLALAFVSAVLLFVCFIMIVLYIRKSRKICQPRKADDIRLKDTSGKDSKSETIKPKSAQGVAETRRQDAQIDGNRYQAVKPENLYLDVHEDVEDVYEVVDEVLNAEQPSYMDMEVKNPHEKRTKETSSAASDSDSLYEIATG